MVKIRDTPRIWKNNFIGISVFVYESKVRYPFKVLRKWCEEKYVDLLLTGEKEKGTMFLSKILMNSCEIIHCIVEKKILLSLLFRIF